MNGQGDLFDTGGPPGRCSQCGQPFTAPACGMGHAAIAAEQAAASARTYYDTTHEPAALVREYSRKAGTQQKIIIDYYLANPTALLTPFEVQAAVLADAPITSVRCAMTNLTDAGILVKTAKKKPGVYGRNNYTWQLAPRLAVAS